VQKSSPFDPELMTSATGGEMSIQVLNVIMSGRTDTSTEYVMAPTFAVTRASMTAASLSSPCASWLTSGPSLRNPTIKYGA
jgi:hypothetical protein